MNKYECEEHFHGTWIFQTDTQDWQNGSGKLYKTDIILYIFTTQ